MESTIGVDHASSQPSKSIITVISGGNTVEVYTPNDSNVFDIIPPGTNTVPGALCNSCISFIKRGDCKKGELQKKETTVKMYECDKYFAKSEVENV